MNWNTSAKKRSSKAKRKHEEMRNSYRPDRSTSRASRSRPIDTVTDEDAIGTGRKKPHVAGPQQSDGRGEAMLRATTIYTKPLRNEFVPPNVSADIFYLGNTKPNRTEQLSTVKSINYDLSVLLELTPTDEQSSVCAEEQTVLFINEGLAVNYEPKGDIELKQAEPVWKDDLTVHSSDEVDLESTIINAENWQPRYYNLENMLPILVKDLIITKENELKSHMKTDFLCARSRLKLLYALYEHLIPQDDITQTLLLEIIRFLEQAGKIMSAQELTHDDVCTSAPAPGVGVDEQQEWVLFESVISVAQSSLNTLAANDSSSNVYSLDPRLSAPQDKSHDDEVLNVKFFL